MRKNCEVGLKGFAICEVRLADNLLDCFGEAFIDHRFNRLLVQLEFVDDTETLFYDFFVPHMSLEHTVEYGSQLSCGGC